MDGEVAQLPLHAVAELLRLGRRPLQRDTHIPQGDQAGLRVLLPILRVLSGLQVEHGEGEYVGGPVHLPHLPVNLVDARVVGEEYADLTGQRDPLRFQSGGDHPVQQGLGLRRALHLGLKDNGVIHPSTPFLSVCHGSAAAQPLRSFLPPPFRSSSTS